MITEEHGLQLQGPDPVRAGATTLAAFLGVGLLPLLPYRVPGVAAPAMFTVSSIATACAFAVVGWFKGHRLDQPRLRAAWDTLWTGGVAAVLACIVGWGLRSALGTA